LTGNPFGECHRRGAHTCLGISGITLPGVRPSASCAAADKMPLILEMAGLAGVIGLACGLATVCLGRGRRAWD
jgi:hypothetical protein